MKRVLVIFSSVAIVLAALSSCKKIIAKVFAGTEVNVPDFSVTVPPITITSSTEIPIGSYSFPFNLDSSVRSTTAGVFGANAVNSIRIKQIKIDITNADSLNNISNFESARVTLQSSSNNTPVELFSVSFPDSYASSYTFTPTSSPELLSYAKGSTITYNIFGKIRRITTKSLKMVLSVTLKAD